MFTWKIICYTTKMWYWQFFSMDNDNAIPKHLRAISTGRLPFYTASTNCRASCELPQMLNLNCVISFMYVWQSQSLIIFTLCREASSDYTFYSQMFFYKKQGALHILNCHILALRTNIFSSSLPPCLLNSTSACCLFHSNWSVSN